MDIGSTDIPLCATCGHSHVQGVRCSVCGHVGKSQIFSKMRAKSSENRSTKVTCLERGNIHTVDGMLDVHSPFHVINQLRVQIADELGLPLRGGLDIPNESTFSHTLCSVGDLPVASARWQLYRNEQGKCILYIDRIMSSNDHRRKAHVHRCLYHILIMVKQSSQEAIDFIELSAPQIPGSEWVSAKLESIGFSSVGLSAEKGWCGIPAMSYVLGVTPGHPEINDLIGHLMRRTSCI